MAVSASECPKRLDRARAVPARFVWFALFLVTLVALPGCGGCSCRMRAKTQAELDREKEEEERRAQLERERLKPPLEADWLLSEPYDPRAKIKTFAYKPGHWTAAMLQAKANHDDLLGELEIGTVDANGNPMGLIATPYALSTERSVALSKKQPKRLDASLFIPATSEKARVTSQITTRRGGRIYEGPAQPATQMPAWQYHLVVLARWPDRYTYIEKLDSCRLPRNLNLDTNDQELYRVVLLQAEKQTTMPASSLFWTSTAYVFWDDAEPDALSVEQKAAMLDWLHWGGQLIISGPESLDALKDSFLGPYLPATSSGTRELGKPDLAELSRHWPVESTNLSWTSAPLAPVRTWSGVRLQCRPEGRFVPKTGDLVADRRVGRGRVVVTAFALSGSELTGWRGFDAFFNGCLLGQPGRRFGEHEGQLTIRRTSGGEVYDPRQLSQLRYFTRDTGREVVPVNLQHDLSFDVASSESSPLPSDVASWCDSNQVANAARNSLKDAARIEIPDRSFVLWFVGVYLVVLVPLNWLIFRGLDRVEWAWIAAPVIAIACTGLVIRLAQLDIGFARSSTEIGVVELEGGYPRAHVTRYTALYTSLSTAYQFQFDEPGAQILPFPSRLDDLTVRFGRAPLRYRYGKDVNLEGLRILSNSTGLVHSEQMLDLGGAISLAINKDGGYELTNGTKLTLHGAGVMRRDEQNRLYAAWLGDVEPRSTRPVAFEYRLNDARRGAPWSVHRDGQSETAQKQPGNESPSNRNRTTGRLNIRAMVDLAEQPILEGAGAASSDPVVAGDARLVAWTDEPLGGMQVQPAAPQARRVAMIVAHLEHGHHVVPDSDGNARPVADDGRRVLNAE